MTTERSECVVLQVAAAYVGCTVRDRLEAGDHWIVYATAGREHAETAQSSEHHRKIGTTY